MPMKLLLKAAPKVRRKARAETGAGSPSVFLRMRLAGPPEDVSAQKHHHAGSLRPDGRLSPGSSPRGSGPAEGDALPAHRVVPNGSLPGPTRVDGEW